MLRWISWVWRNTKTLLRVASSTNALLRAVTSQEQSGLNVVKASVFRRWLVTAPYRGSYQPFDGWSWLSNFSSYSVNTVSIRRISALLITDLSRSRIVEKVWILSRGWISYKCNTAEIFSNTERFQQFLYVCNNDENVAWEKIGCLSQGGWCWFYRGALIF